MFGSSEIPTPPPPSWRSLDGEPIRIGISACLLGREVRFNGGHKRDAFLADTLGLHVQWVPVCPEVELGLGTPRESLRLERADEGVRMVSSKTGRDVTAEMREFARRKVSRDWVAELCGYVLRRDSPSCGLGRVKVYDAAGMAVREGTGIFAEALHERFPELPVEEDGRLQDPRARDNFLERVFACRRLRTAFREDEWTPDSIATFHAAHKYILQSHSPRAHLDLSLLLEEGAELAREEFRARYQIGFMQALAKTATPGLHVNVLQHLMSLLRKNLDEFSRNELQEAIEDYRRSRAPLIVPITLIRHHVRRLELEPLQGQLYLEPDPREVMLRNHG